MKIISIVGARPQFIKEAMIQKELKKHPHIEKKLIHTGQHYDYQMSESFFDNLKLDEPDYYLNINNATHGEMTGKMMIEIEKILMNEKPDYVILYGDTNSTLAGAIVSRKMNIKIVHVEAGLRQEPKSMPEEINRVLTDHSSSLLFVPSKRAVNTLKHEGIEDGVYISGDIMFDLYIDMKPYFSYDFYKTLTLPQNKYIVCTLHRDFNVDSKEILHKILQELNRVSSLYPVVMPLHPRTRARIKDFSLESECSNIKIIEPLDYLSLMGLISSSLKVITDSGGLQKEAYYSGKEALILMPDTAWIELVENKYNYLCDASSLYELSLKEPEPVIDQTIYGDGHAAKIIIDKIIEDFNVL